MSKATQLAKQSKLQEMRELLYPSRLSEQDKARLQLYFGKDSAIYTALRDCFLGFELSEEQKNILKNIGIKDLLRTIFLPEVKKEIPLGQNYDLWQTQDLKTVTTDFEALYDAKVRMLEYLEASLARVANPDLPGVDLSVQKSNAQVLARNAYIGYVDQQIRFIIQFVNMDTLSPEEQMQMFKQNSNK